MDYIIVPTSKCLYQEWQLRLLQWSASKVKQKGKIIFLISQDYNHQTEVTNFDFPGVETLFLPDWAKEWELTNNNDWWGGIPNKYESIKWLTQNKQFNNSDRILFLDPDMIFTEAIDLYPQHDEVIGQKWEGFTPLPEFPSSLNTSIMYPFAVTFYTLKKIVDSYRQFCIDIRKRTGRWESEMWGLSHAFESHSIKFTPLSDLGRCTLWNFDDSKNKSKLIHFPNPIESKDGEKLFFKQDYTFNLTQKIEVNKSRNTTDTLLLSNVDQQRTNYIYDNNIDSSNIFKFYTGGKGYLFFQPWPGGFNNIRMSYEQAVGIAYLTNRTLVLPPTYDMYLLSGNNNLESFFNTYDLGIKSLKFEEFCSFKGIESNLDKLKEISKILDYDSVANIINFEKIPVPKKFVKQRNVINSEDLFDNSEIIYLDKNLLGSFHQSLYTKHETALKQLIAKYVVYRSDLRDIAWQFINHLEDKSYYSIHIRRNDFQYKHLFISGEEIYNNVKDIIPNGSKLYIATDADDKSLFEVLKQHYQVVFYDDVRNNVNIQGFNNDWIPIIEQLICSRGIKFIGNENSTLSSYIYRLRCYMNDIEDKNYYLNTVSQSPSTSNLFLSETNYQSNWVREYEDINYLDNSVILISIASYMDTQIFDTIKSLYGEVSNPNKVRVIVHLQDTQEQYNKFLELEYPNLEVIFTPNTEAQGVVWARNRIKDKYNNESYFLQVDSHSRFKENWDLILINQYNSIEEPKVILSTYPNHFDVPDPDKKYLNLPYNTPLVVDRFVHPESDTDNRLKMKNLPSLEDYQVVDTKWVAAGFLFTRGEWINEVKVPEQMVFSGEEDAQTHISYLKGWNIKVASEATVWHNYNYKTTEETPYRIHNNEYHLQDNSISEVNNFLFNQTYERSIKDLENYLGITFKGSPNILPKTIFIALASYIDNDLRNTILSCINQAKHPENLVLGVCLQYNDELETNERCIDDLVEKYNIRIKKFRYEESKGNAWARYQVSDLYQDEDYVLQIDSHLRLTKHWDELLINEHSKLKGNPIISYLSPSFKRNEELNLDYQFDNLDSLTHLNIPKITDITDEYWPRFQGYTNMHPTNGLNKIVPILYCGFVFAKGNWIKEIKNDPEHYYTGEEFALSIRSFTHGYDIYQPTRVISWHRANDNHIHHFKVVNDNDERHAHAVSRLRKLVLGGDLGGYGLGTKRTLQEYENFAKINIKEKRVYT